MAYIFFFFSRLVVPEFIPLDMIENGTPELLPEGTSAVAFTTKEKFSFQIELSVYAPTIIQRMSSAQERSQYYMYKVIKM